MSKLIEMRGKPGSIQYDGIDQLCKKIRSILGDELMIVEIGSYQGESTKIISENFPNSLINAVDIWSKYIESISETGEDNFYTELNGDFSKLNYSLENQEIELNEAEEVFDKLIIGKNIKKNKMPSVEFAEKTPNDTVDFIYIDGNHQYSSVKEDLITWLPKLKKIGIISGHDFGWRSVNKALIEIFNRNPDEVFQDGSWYYTVKNNSFHESI